MKRRIKALYRRHRMEYRRLLRVLRYRSHTCFKKLQKIINLYRKKKISKKKFINLARKNTKKYKAIVRARRIRRIQAAKRRRASIKHRTKHYLRWLRWRKGWLKARIANHFKWKKWHMKIQYERVRHYTILHRKGRYSKKALLRLKRHYQRWNRNVTRHFRNIHRWWVKHWNKVAHAKNLWRLHKISTKVYQKRMRHLWLSRHDFW